MYMDRSIAYPNFKLSYQSLEKNSKSKALRILLNLQYFSLLLDITWSMLDSFTNT